MLVPAMFGMIRKASIAANSYRWQGSKKMILVTAVLGLILGAGSVILLGAF